MFKKLQNIVQTANDVHRPPTEVTERRIDDIDVTKQLDMECAV